MPYTSVPTPITATFTRPNDTTAYASGDQVSNSTSAPVAMTFTGCSRTELSSGLITSVMLMDETNQGTLGSFEVWLFDTIPTINNDNAAFAPSQANLTNLLPGGVVAMGTGLIANTSSNTTGSVIFQQRALSIPFRCSTTTNLYGCIVVRNAYTPIANEVFLIRLGIIQD